MADDDTLTTRLVAAMNVGSSDINGDGLDERPQDSLFTASEVDRTIAAMSAHEKGSVITKEILARRWGIWRYKTRQAHIRYPSLNTRFDTDTMFSTSKSLSGNNCAQVFTNGASYNLFYPTWKKSEAGDALLNSMIRTVGVPKDLASNGAGEETGGAFSNSKTVKEYKIWHRLSEPYSPWQNRAESSIREIKSGIRCAMFRARSPKRLWDYCGEWVSTVRQLTAHDIPSLGGKVLTETVDGSTPNISAYSQFHWYEYVWFYDPAQRYSHFRQTLASWHGGLESPMSEVGNPMTF
jgi:hypothetical protein